MLNWPPMLCVMIAAKQQRFSIDAQNRQKSTKNQQHITTTDCQRAQDIKQSEQQQQQQELAASKANQDKQHETSSEKATMAAISSSNTTMAAIMQGPSDNGQQQPPQSIGGKKPINSPLNGASLTTTSTKIQQKQQKFLAAAAKSATSPPSAMIASSSLLTSTIGQPDNRRLQFAVSPNKAGQSAGDTYTQAYGEPLAVASSVGSTANGCCQPVVVFDAAKIRQTQTQTATIGDGGACRPTHAARSVATMTSMSTARPAATFAAVATSRATVTCKQQQQSPASPVARISLGAEQSSCPTFAIGRHYLAAPVEEAADQTIERAAEGVSAHLTASATGGDLVEKRRQLREGGSGSSVDEHSNSRESEKVEIVDSDDREKKCDSPVSLAADQTGYKASSDPLQTYHHQATNIPPPIHHFTNNNHNNKFPNTAPDNHHHHHHHHHNHNNNNHQQHHHQANHYYQHNHHQSQNNHNKLIATAAATSPSHPNHQYHHTQSINYNNCTKNALKTPTTQNQQHHQETLMKLKEQRVSPIIKDNITCSTLQSIGANSSSPNNNNNINQDNITMSSGAGQQASMQRQQFNNFNTTNSHYPLHHHHHNQQQQQQLQQQQHQTMAHYKFHNDCQSSVLTYEQVKRLDFVMDQTVPIHGRGNFPTLYVKLKELIRLVKYKLQKEHSIQIRDVRLNGGAASYVLAPENSHYNDLDLIFGTDLSNEDQFDVIRDVVLECLEEFFPKEHQESHSQGETATDTITSGMANSTMVDGTSKAAGDKLNEQSSNQKAQVNQQMPGDLDKLKPTNSVDTGDTGLKSAEETEANTETGKRATGESFNNSRGNHHLTDPGSGFYQQGRQLGDHAASLAPQNFQYHQMPLSTCAIKEAYVHKMVKVNDDDRWSLISLGVQQSEVNCCGSNNCPILGLQRTSQQVCCNCCASNQHHFADSVGTESEQHRLINNKSSVSVQLIQKENSMRNQHQFPNSIELKFVDRMRRKFEFSVDSFQIILDSLIQFYDCAPQSTITSQRSLMNPHLASTMINTRTSVNKKRCVGCCGTSNAVPSCKIGDNNSGSLSRAEARRESYSHTQNHQSMGAFTGSKSCVALVNSSRSYYQLPIESANSSAASSSGCSSSSSVVSSSSSSLSCDEDHEDFYCDTDCPSSSSTSTSSLLSSTTLSLPSSDILRNGSGSNLQKFKMAQIGTEDQSQQNQCNTDDDHDVANREPSAVAGSPNSQATSKRDASGCCIGCCGQRKTVNSIHDCDTSDRMSCAVISENFYPTVIGRSEYGNFKEALYHLEKKLIATRSPEEIRGGGMLKYCNLLVKGYKPVNVYQIRTLERYMCSRFFIDFSDLNQQQAKLESYLANHFSDDPMLKFDYLTILHNVVQRSTVCLMNHELRLTLDMIRDLAYKLNEQRQQHQQFHQQPQVSSQNSPMAAQLHNQAHQQNLTQAQQQQQQQYYKQKPVLIQSGVYRVKLVNYTLAKPTRT